ncbi:MAG: NrfD/PsrC family molybdoenzyme membrane anchor subunit [Planctomycetota bacterium]
MAEHPLPDTPPQQPLVADDSHWRRQPLVDGNITLADVTASGCSPTERLPGGRWFVGFVVASAMLALGIVATVYTVLVGMGVWGLNRTVGWAFDITNFVFWVGIGHAGTMISALLFLLAAHWRTAIGRTAEAMTIFAISVAAIFPLIHMGRPWLFYWVFPYPNERGPMWVNFTSPLLWDVFALNAYLLVSTVFWYVGMLPDLATVRDRAKGLRRRIYGILALGWDGSQRTWSRYETVYLLLAGLGTALVISVCGIVSMDFATSVIPGWHATIFPLYFLSGALFSGFAMVLTLLIPLRWMLGLEQMITKRHIDVLCKVTLMFGLFVSLVYVTEAFMCWYSGSEYEQFFIVNRFLGPLAPVAWTMICGNVLIPQLLWFKGVRSRLWMVLGIALAINVGMWCERFVIIAMSLHRDFLPAAWSNYMPSWTEIAILIGSFGLFFTLFLLFVRVLPVIAMAEVKSVLKLGRRQPAHSARIKTAPFNPDLAPGPATPLGDSDAAEPSGKSNQSGGVS